MYCYNKKTGRMVELVPGQLFDTHWNYYEVQDGVRVIRQGIPGVDLEWREQEQASVIELLPTIEPEVNLTPEPPKLSKPIDPEAMRIIYERKPEGGYKDFEQFKEINSDLDLDWEVAKSSMKFGAEVNKININTISINQLATKLPGIGKSTAKKIVDRKPQGGGYKDFDHLREINSDINLDHAAWEKVQELVEF